MDNFKIYFKKYYSRKLFKLTKIEKNKQMKQINELKTEEGYISRENIKKIIPYDEPFLFIDSVVSLSKDKIVAIKELSGKDLIKCITPNEKIFKFYEMTKKGQNAINHFERYTGNS